MYVMSREGMLLNVGDLTVLDGPGGCIASQLAELLLAFANSLN